MGSKIKKFPLRVYILRALRRIWNWWPARREARAIASTGFDHYKCAECGGVFPRRHTHVDHINPVVEPEVGFVDYDTYINRLFCDVENLRVLCKMCHKRKTKKENLERKRVKASE